LIYPQFIPCAYNLVAKKCPQTCSPTEFFMRLQPSSTLLVLAVVFGGIALAQQNSQVTAPSKPKSIFIGQSLKSVSAILNQQRIEFGEEGGSFASDVEAPRQSDISNLSFTLDENHTHVYAFFSKSKQTITGLHVEFIPSRRSPYKAYQSHLSATEVTLYPDTSYAVHFSKPLTREELDEADANRPKDEVPKSR
jgi:hypothetical protein